MQVFSLRFYWRIGQAGPPDPGLIALTSASPDTVIEESENIWVRYVKSLQPQPIGYLIYHDQSKQIVYERGPSAFATGAARRPRRALPAARAPLEAIGRLWRRVVDRAAWSPR